MFEVIFLFDFFSLSSKSASFAKLAISISLAKFASGYPALKFSDLSLINY